MLKCKGVHQRDVALTDSLASLQDGHLLPTILVILCFVVFEH